MLQTFNVPAGGRIVNAKASFFRYESASAGGADESLRVRADGNDLGTYLPGDSITLPVDAKTWEMVPVTATATAIVRVGVGGVESSRIFGNVRVIDSERDKVAAGVCYRGVSQYTGNLAAVEVWNPTGSGKNLFVQAIRAGASAADSWGIQTSDFQLASGGSTPSNLDRSGVASVALMRVGDSSTLTNPKGHGAGYISASTDVIVVMPRPILLRPGTGCAFYVNSAANTLRATFEWEEWNV